MHTRDAYGHTSEEIEQGPDLVIDCCLINLGLMSSVKSLLEQLLLLLKGRVFLRLPDLFY